MTEKNCGWFSKRPAFVKLDILSSRATLSEGVLSPAHLAGVGLTMFAGP